MQQVRPRMRFADLERLPEDGRRYELHDGVLLEVPSPLPRHQRVALNVAELLRDYERAHGGLVFLAPLDIVLDESNVVQPDVVFFSASRAATIDMRRPIRLAPDLAVEILSPATERVDRGGKLALLARFGIHEYWLVDPIACTLEQFSLEGSGYTLAKIIGLEDSTTSRTLPGLTIAAARIFAP